MNKSFLLGNLAEARDLLEQMMLELKTDREYDTAKLQQDFKALFGHINTAWNARAASEEVVGRCTREDLERWRVFPVELM